MIADLELVKRAQTGEKQAFSMLVERHQKTMMRVALRVTKDLERAEDVVQESFIKAYEKLTAFEGRSSFKSWMYQITVNTAKNKIRKTRREIYDLDVSTLSSPAQSEQRLAYQDLQLFV
ncbi:MAG: sigma-70 family RNA polymerase sigma factor, partial [Bdellovibrionales bacterium]|nr:sigma-70 family RNA polymerase sigma factor [Bdellovibrionales bacterium]